MRDSTARMWAASAALLALCCALALSSACYRPPDYVVDTIIDYIAAQVDFPEVDIRQRLTVSKGYGVTEIHIPEGSHYVGQAIDESGLPEKDINILTLYRGTTVIPNPRLKRTLEAGDRLLCFGKLESMRELIPAKFRKKRRPKVLSLPDSAGTLSSETT